MIAQLPPDLAEFVASELAIGRYESEAQLVCDAVRMLQAQRQDLRAALELGAANEELDIVLEDDEALDRFFEALHAEVVEELRSKAI